MKFGEIASMITGVPGPVESRIYERNGLDADTALPLDVAWRETALIYAERAVEIGGRALFLTGVTALASEMAVAVQTVFQRH